MPLILRLGSTRVNQLRGWVMALCVGLVPKPLVGCDALELSAVPEKATAQKYKEVFYPSGMPTRENPFSQASERTVYSFFDGLDVSQQEREVVAYSERIPNEKSDQVFWAYLGVLSKTKGGLSLLHTLEVTPFMLTFTEFPGNFKDMDARLNRFELGPGLEVVHVNLWSVLAGTGYTSGASDLFFTLGPDGAPQLVLELKATSEYTREGAERVEARDSSIWLSDVDGDGQPELVVEEKELPRAGAGPKVQAKAAVVYKFAAGKFELAPGLKLTGSVRGTALVRSEKIFKVR